MNLILLLAVATGGMLGCVLRWLIALALNPVLPSLPLGTLAVNLVGGFIIGLALGYFTEQPDASPALRLFITTGFCGGLTTFSAFSWETVALMLRQQYGWAMTLVATHVLGSLAMTFAGFFLMRLALRT